jgi:pyruvate dehydrogenase E1 component alpha subunit
MQADELIAFERDIASLYNAGAIRAPIHLSSGNEQQLIEAFKGFKQNDWCYCTWRSHLHALLAGVPAAKVKAAIMAGRSMTLCFPEHRFFSSAIVAGCCPIAVGTAWQIRQRGGKERVFCFLGDMAALTGLAFECGNYAKWHDLPITWVVEDNGMSVCTDTLDAWGCKEPRQQTQAIATGYNYVLGYPHSGAGRRVNF